MGLLVSFAIISCGVSRSLCNNLSSSPAMSYNKFCAVPLICQCEGGIIIIHTSMLLRYFIKWLSKALKEL